MKKVENANASSSKVSAGISFYYRGGKKAQKLVETAAPYCSGTSPPPNSSLIAGDSISFFIFSLFMRLS